MPSTPIKGTAFKVNHRQCPPGQSQAMTSWSITGNACLANHRKWRCLSQVTRNAFLANTGNTQFASYFQRQWCPPHKIISFALLAGHRKCRPCLSHHSHDNALWANHRHCPLDLSHDIALWANHTTLPSGPITRHCPLEQSHDIALWANHTILPSGIITRHCPLANHTTMPFRPITRHCPLSQSHDIALWANHRHWLCFSTKETGPTGIVLQSGYTCRCAFQTRPPHM
jgi:hypothetical protein